MPHQFHMPNMEIEHPTLWPPEVAVKKHPRAKHVKLRATTTHGLELIVPKRFNVKEIPAILEQNRRWIEKQLLKIKEDSRQYLTLDLPENIQFQSLQQIWNIHYQKNSGKLIIITRPHQALVVSGDIDNKINCKKILTKWIKKFATDHLLQRLKEISSEIELPYSRATIRDQSSRWGSCSSQKSISLNYKLIFLPIELMRHIIIHELCHTQFLNHSTKFWNLVERFDEEWKSHRNMMRQADHYIPRWIQSI